MFKGSTEPQAGEASGNRNSAERKASGVSRLALFAAISLFLLMSAAIAGMGVLVHRAYRLEPVSIAPTPAPASESVATKPLPAVVADKPRNIVLLIADGAGFGHYAAARLHSAGVGGHLSVDRMPVIGLIETRSADRIITDSAAAATAIASGVKTNNGYVGVDPAGKPLSSFFEDARRAGKSTGIVATTSVVDGTPAAFYAHTRERSFEDEIAAALPKSGLDLVLGAGYPHFLPESKGGGRQDVRDVLSEMKAGGYLFARTREDLDRIAATPGKLLGLFRAHEIAAGGTGPSLSGMAEVALDRLAANPSGFVLMIEGSLIDDSSHLRDVGGMLAEMQAFDRAVGEVLAYAAKHGDTLVIVTSDHECGGLLIEDPMHGATDGSLYVQWNTGLRRTSHSGGTVPLFAYGPGAAAFAGTRDNTDIAKSVRAALR